MLKYIPILRDIDFDRLFIKMNEVDFEGQKLSEKMYKMILITFLVISMVISYATQTLSHGIFIMLGGLAVSMIICVPSWSCYNKSHLKWVAHKKKME